MRIPCPLCGSRDAQEFSYLGDARLTRPDPADDAAMIEYVYLRENPAGPIQEYWYHAAGCHAWLVVSRNTRTHDISAVEIASDIRRKPAGEAA
jgi:heterotetrameric sarcosine oxidase delta subunit